MGEYKLSDGRSVSFTDGDTLRDVADLVAVVNGEYKGTPSATFEALKEMLGHLQEGRPLSGMETTMLRRILDRYSSELAAFRASPENDFEGFVPVPSAATGRISEVMAMLPPSMRATVRESYLGLPTVAVDFDGVIHQGSYGASGGIDGALMPGATSGLATLAKKYRVVVLTARADLDAVRVWLRDQGLSSYVNQVTNTKPPALVYIDDRAVHFTNWPEITATVDTDSGVRQLLGEKGSV